MKTEEKKLKAESGKYTFLDPYTGFEVETTHTEDYWKRKYAEYMFEYRKAEAKLEAHGKTMAQAPITDFNSFVVAAMNASTEEKEKGTKKSSVSAIVREQTYEFSRKTALGIQKLYKEKTGEKLDIQDIRTEHDPEKQQVYFDLLNELYSELKDQGMSSKQASHFIAHTFFGSP